MRPVASHESEVTRGWWSCLNAPWSSNPFVVVVALPRSWTIHIRETVDDKYKIAAMHSPQGTVKAMQVVDAGMADYMEHRSVFAKYGLEPADPAYIGKLGGVYDELLLNLDMEPLAIMRDAAWRNPLGLRRCWTRSDLKC
jgi:hypothetical protein